MFTLYAYDDTTSMLYEIDPVTAAATAIGAPGVAFGGLSGDDMGNLYGVNVNGTDFYQVDRMTGASTQLFSLIGGVTLGEGDLDFQFSTGLFYGIDFFSSNLVQIDQTAMTATNVNIANVGGTNAGSGIHWDGQAFRNDTLYGYVGVGAGNTGLMDQLFTIDLTTAAVTAVGGLGINTAGAGGLAYDPQQDFFYLMSTSSGDLYSVDPTTGTASLIGDTGLSFVTTIVTVITPPPLQAPQTQTFVAPQSATAGTLVIDGDLIFGDNGNDSLEGSSANDLIDGGAGRDTIRAAEGDDSILGGAGADSIDAGSGNDDIDGQADNDVINGGTGNDCIHWDGSGDGADIVQDSQGAHRIVAQGDARTNNFIVDSNGGFLRVSEGNASITASNSVTSVSVLGGNGDDTITLNSIDDVRPTNVVIDGQAGDDTITALNARFGQSIVSLNGGAGNDTITGGTEGDRIDGGDDDDDISGSTGDDIIDGGAGNDVINGNEGNDTLLGNAGRDTLNGGDNDDSLSGGFGNDVLMGDGGNDTIRGGFGNDNLNGSAGDDLLDGDQDNDTLVGGTGADSLDGGTGNDTLKGQAGADQIKGGDGNDHIEGNSGADTINAGDGNDTVLGGNGRDLINAGDGNDNVNGMSGRDTILGGDGNDTLLGGGSADFLYGGNGSDTLRGNSGTDRFNSGQGGLAPKDLQPGESDDQNLLISTSVQAALDKLSGF